MNIEFKESLFRFIFPPSIFWGLIILSENHFDILNPKDSFTLIILFVFSGIIISSVSSLFTNSQIRYNKRFKWLQPQEEYKNWKNIDKEKSDFIKNKIERRWNFYVVHQGCLCAVVCFYFYKKIFLGEHFSQSIAISLILLLILFFFLLRKAFKDSKFFNEQMAGDANKIS